MSTIEELLKQNQEEISLLKNQAQKLLKERRRQRRRINELEKGIKKLADMLEVNLKDMTTK